MSDSSKETSHISNSNQQTSHNSNFNEQTSQNSNFCDNSDSNSDSDSDSDFNKDSDDEEKSSDDGVDSNKIKNDKMDFWILKKYDYIAPNYEETKNHQLKKLHVFLHMSEQMMKFGERSYWNTETYETSNKHNVSALYAKSSKRRNTIIKEMTNLSLLKRHLQYIETYINMKQSCQDSNIDNRYNNIHSVNKITFNINREFRVLSLICNNDHKFHLKTTKGKIVKVKNIFVQKDVSAKYLMDEISNFVGFQFFETPKLLVQNKKELVHSANDKVKNCNIKLFASVTMTNMTIKDDILLYGFPMERHEIRNNDAYQKNSFIVIRPDTYGIISYMFSCTVKNKTGMYEYKYGASVMLLKEDKSENNHCTRYPFKRYLWDECNGKIKEKTISFHSEFLDVCFGFKFAKDNYRIVNLAKPNVTNDYFILVPNTFFQKPEFERITNDDVFSTNEHQYWINRVR
jgi:hypothetical protein